MDHHDEHIAQEWKPDCLDRFLGCWKNSPKTTAATGYYMLRIIFSVITVHSAIIFAGVITYAALEVTHCLDSNSDEGSCGNKADDANNDEKQCVRLWGLIKGDSLLTVIGTVAAIILALSATITGTAMDVTPYRRQIGLVGNIFCIFGMCLCLSLFKPTSDTLIISSIGLILVLVFKDYVLMQVDSYGPELSKVPAEIGSAISGAFTWSLIANVLLIIIWSLVGFGMDNNTFGFVVTIGSIILLGLSSLITYRRLPDVPAAHKVPEGMSIAKFTFHRLIVLIWETYYDYPDLGMLLLAGMIFDPALTALLAAAVLIMISKYQFTADQVTTILGIAIVAAIPAVPLSRWLASTPLLSCFFGDAAEKTIVHPFPPEEINVSGFEGSANHGSIEMVSSEKFLSPAQLAEIEKEEEESALAANDAGESTVEDGRALNAGAAGGACAHGVEAAAAPADTKHPAFHPHRVRFFLILGLVLVIINTILVVGILQACDLGLAHLFSCIWGFLMSFCWNNYGMLRMSLVPGGRESEYAGLFLAMFSSIVWLPLFIFSVANEVWSIDGALYMLTIFFGVGGLLLMLVNIDRALSARLSTLNMRRWAHVLMAQKQAAIGTPGKLQSTADGAPTTLKVDLGNSSEHGTAEGSSQNGSTRLDNNNNQGQAKKSWVSW